MRDSGQRTAVVLDRHPLWVEAMAELVKEIGVEVVVRATDINEAVAAVEEHRPDLLVAGLGGSSMSDVEFVRRAKDAYPELKPVVMAEDDSPEAAERAFAAGAAIYCVKTAERDDLSAAIRQAFSHSIFVAAAPRQTSLPSPVIEAKEAAPDLTRREMEILQLVAEGHSNSQLARMLWVTEQTVKFHLSNIYRKLNVANRTEASRWAQLNGLLPETRQVAAAQAV